MRFSLLFRIYLATAVALTALFAATIWFVQRQAGEALRESLRAEARASLDGVDALWQSRAAVLASASRLLASMSDVRAAFGTRDAATIRDTAGELWNRTGNRQAAFLVADPHGLILASVGATPPPALDIGNRLPFRSDSRTQISGFASMDGELWQVILTPVYVSAGNTDALLNVLLAAHPLRIDTLRDLQKGAGGDFILRAGDRTAVSTLSNPDSVFAHPDEFAMHRTDLADLGGHAIGQLWAVRSLTGVQTRVADLRRTILFAWLAAMAAGLAFSYLLTRRIVEPLRVLNTAAQQVSDENYSVRVPETGNDEIGLLARTFNRMSASIENTRQELVRREQITAIGRLAASVAHDLRNPLSAIVGGAEMLVEFELPPEQTKKTILHMHQAAKRMQSLLAELGQVARTKPGQSTECSLAEVVSAAVDAQDVKAIEQEVALHVDVPDGLVAKCERSRLERVFVNLIANALEVMPSGGEIRITGARQGSKATIDVQDTGPGIPHEIRARMFQPFTTAGKKNGLGLGLALARQTLVDHEGDLELLPSERGARFRVTLPASGARSETSSIPRS
jgi:signal transduction histidine kinase